MGSNNSERYHRHQAQPVRQHTHGWVHQPQYNHEFQDPQTVASWPPDNAAEVDPNAIDPPEYVGGRRSSAVPQRSQPVPAYPQGGTNYDYPQMQGVAFPSALPATMAYRPHPQSSHASVACYSDPATAAYSVKNSAYSPSPSETSTSPKSPTVPLAKLSSGDDLNGVGTWDTGEGDYPAPQDTRGREKSKPLRITNFPGRSIRSDSTEAHRPSSPKKYKSKKKHGSKKSVKSGH